jgi:hypothetical protein
MPKTILTTGGIPTATTANTIQYWPLAVTSIEGPSATEANKQILHRSPGTLSQLYVKVTANTINATSTIIVRKNAADTGLSLTVGANATGAFENTIDTISVAAGDKLNYQTTPGAATGTMSISVLSVLFEATINTVTRLATSGTAANYATASVSRYNLIAGNHTVTSTTEPGMKCKIRKAGTGKNLAVYVSANARTTDTTVRTRKNALNGNCLITIGPGATGWFEDTTNSDTLAIADDYDIVTTTSTGTQTLTVQSTSLDFINTSGWGVSFNARGATFTINAASTNYFPIGGATNAGSGEGGSQQKTRIRTQYSDLIINVVTTNTITADSTLKLRKNGVDTSLTVTIPASTIGLFSDTTHTEIFTETDDINLQLVGGSTGTSLSMSSITMSIAEILPVLKTLSETDTIGESKTRTKGVWRLQP